MANNPFTGKRKTLIQAALIVGAIILALGVGMLLRTLQGDDKAGAPSAGSSAVNGPVIPLSDQVKTIDKLAAAGKLDEANKYIADELAKPSATNDQKYDLYDQQGLIAYNSGKFDVALDAYLKADAIKQSYGLSEAIGSAAARLGKKDVAVTYYKKALVQLNKKDPLYDTKKVLLERKVRDQGGSL